MGSFWTIAASVMAVFGRFVAADIAFGPWGFILAFWPVILIGLIIIAIVLLVRIIGRRNKK